MIVSNNITIPTYIFLIIALKCGAQIACSMPFPCHENVAIYTTNLQLIINTTTDYHHTVQVVRVQVQYLRQWLDEKVPAMQVAEGDTTTCASGLSALVAE